MKCPNCGSELRYPEYAWHNMDSYGKAVTVATLCCGVAVRLIPRMEVEAVATKGITEDDWSNPCNTYF